MIYVGFLGKGLLQQLYSNLPNNQLVKVLEPLKIDAYIRIDEPLDRPYNVINGHIGDGFRGGGTTPAHKSQGVTLDKVVWDSPIVAIRRAFTTLGTAACRAIPDEVYASLTKLQWLYARP